MSKQGNKSKSHVRGSKPALSLVNKPEAIRDMTADALARGAGFPDAATMDKESDKYTVAAVAAIASRVQEGTHWSLADTLEGFRCFGQADKQGHEVAVLMSRAYQRGQLLITELASAWQVESEKDYGERFIRKFAEVCKGSSITLAEFEGKLAPEHEALRGNRLKYLSVKVTDNGGALESVVMERRDPNASKVVNLKDLRESLVSRVGAFCEAAVLRGGTDYDTIRKALDLAEKAVIERIDETRDEVTAAQQKDRDTNRAPDNTGTPGSKTK